MVKKKRKKRRLYKYEAYLHIQRRIEWRIDGFSLVPKVSFVQANPKPSKGNLKKRYTTLLKPNIISLFFSKEQDMKIINNRIHFR